MHNSRHSFGTALGESRWGALHDQWAGCVAATETYGVFAPAELAALWCVPWRHARPPTRPRSAPHDKPSRFSRQPPSDAGVRPPPCILLAAMPKPPLDLP